MDGFKRATPKQRPQAGLPTPPPVGVPSAVQSQTEAAPVALPPIDHLDDKGAVKAQRKRRWPLFVVGIFGVLLALAGGSFFWYQQQLQPVNTGDNEMQRIEITEGASLSYVASRLEERGVIRSGIAFKVMAHLQGKQSAIRAGTCSLNPTLSAQEILDKITAGCHDFKSITFYPGATLEPSLYSKTRATQEGKEFKDMSIRASLRAAGYGDDAIDEAFAMRYDSPLFEGKPVSEGYEGYVFGETYYVAVDASAQEVLKMAFDHFYAIVKENDLITKYKEQGLSLYEGITLASIIGRELDCEGKPTEERKQRCFGYQQQIAEVFYNRLASGMSLGSDVTSIYASDKLSVPSSVDVDSPYNTRRYPGLTPGPIATAGKLALLSAAEPTKGNNLYFLAGDDGLIYFATNNAGHEANIVNHCKVGCGDL